MFAEVSSSVSGGIKNLSVSPTLPTDFAELAFDVAVQSISNGTGRPPELEGSGAQPFILLHFLDLVDRVSRGRSFGWEQASVWAFEEPESFLHSGLRARFAEDLSRYARDERRQIFLTTHQDEFVCVSEASWLTTHQASGTSVEELSSSDGLKRSNRLAITSYRHPLLGNDNTPVVIVEGAFDQIYLRAAIKESLLRPRWRVVAPDEFLGDGTAGDALLQYLKYNKDALASRPNTAPVVILRDWETNDSEKYARVLSVHEYSAARKMPVSLANPELGETFRGIERYLPRPLIEDQTDPEKLMISKGNRPVLQINRSHLNDAKKKMAGAVASGAAVGQYMTNLVAWLDKQVEEVLAAVPVEDFV